ERLTELINRGKQCEFLRKQIGIFAFLIVFYMAKKKRSRKWVKWLLYSIAAVVILFFGLYGSIYIGLWGKVPGHKELANLSQMEASRVYGKDSLLIGKYFTKNREVIQFKDLPEDLIHALIA